MPEVTVLMPVYNGMPFLSEAVDSILNQTLQDFTFLIINDGSTDETEEYLDRLDDPRLQVVHQPNQGLGAALNSGLAMCKTEFIARMDSDDVSLPSRLKAQLNFLHCHKDVGLVGTKFAYLGISGRSGFPPPAPQDHSTIYADLIQGRQALCHPSIMCRTYILKSTGGYRIHSSGEDYDMFLRMGEAAKLANLDEVLYLYRLNPNSVSVKKFLEIREKYSYSCHCARRRAEGKPEGTFEEFAAEQRARPFRQRALEAMDNYALALYRKALAEILGPHLVIGYIRLALAAISSPRWTAQRIFREIRKYRK
jgi:glycosyltransferase involved in cell wall biosynthesis